MDERESGRLEFLDGLRGLAILAVVVFHYWQTTWLNLGKLIPGLDLGFLPRAGYLGVELFFFLSGFCLYWPYASGRPPEGRRAFLARRFWKIFPSYVLAMGAAWWLSPGERPTDHILANVAAHLTFTHNLWLETAYSIHGVFWSLAVEVQFYLLFPWLVLMFRRAPWPGALLLAAIAVGWRLVALDRCATDHNRLTLALSQLPSTLDLFAAGMLAAYLVGRGGIRNRTLSACLLLAGLAAGWALVAGGGVGGLDPPKWQALWRAPLAFVCAVVAVGAAGAPRPLQIAIALPPLRFLGAISYNLYLWHKIVANVLQARRIPQPFGDPHTDPDWQWQFLLLASGLSIAVASALTYGFERPLIRWGKRKEAGHRPAPG